MRSFSQISEKLGDTAIFTFGRFNPPTTGHEKLIDALAREQSKNTGSKMYVFPSQSQNPKKDPLPFALKVAYMRKMFPKYAKNIMANKKVKMVFDIAVDLHNKGHRSIVMVVGSDRVTEFDTLLNKYNGVNGRHGYYGFDNIEVVSAGERDPDAEGVTGMSASKMRAAAVDGDFDTFKMGVPSGFRDALKLYNDVRKNMGIREERDMGEMTDFESLRDLYLTGKLWNIGDIVEAHGIKGKVINKGTNYLSFVDENNKVHKTWLHDINEKKFDIDFKKRYSPKGVINLKDGEHRINDIEAESEDEAIKKAMKIGKFRKSDVTDVNLIERNYAQEYERYQGTPEQIARRSSRNKARRIMGDKVVKGMDVGHKDNNPMNNDPSNLRNEDPSVNRKEPRLREVKQDKDIKSRDGTQPAKYYAKDTEGDAMSKSTKQARARHFDKKKKGPAPGDASATTRPSKHTKKFKQMYGEKDVKIPLELLKLYNQGMKLPAGSLKHKEVLKQIDDMKKKLGIKEKLGKNADAGDYIDDFQKSDAPQFKGKSKEKRKDMAIAAYLDKKDKKENHQVDEALSMTVKGKGKEKYRLGYDQKFTLNGKDYVSTGVTKQQVYVAKGPEGEKVFSKKELEQLVKKGDIKFTDMGSINQEELHMEFYQLDEKIEGLVTKAKKSGMPYGILKKVYDRGMAAYKTGHRPGTTAQQWAFARVNSFVTKSSGTWGKADKDLADKVRASEEVEIDENVETEIKSAMNNIPHTIEKIDDYYVVKVNKENLNKTLETLDLKNTGMQSGNIRVDTAIDKTSRNKTEEIKEWFESNQTRASYQLRYEDDWWWKLNEVHDAMLEKIGADCCDDCAENLEEQKVGGYNVDNDVVIRKGNKYHKTVDNLFKSKSDAQKFAKEFDGFVIPQSGGRFIVGLNKVTEEVDESLWANIHKKRQRIKQGSGEKMRKKGEKGAPSAAQLKRAKGEEALRKVKGTDNLYEPKKMSKSARVRSMMDYLGKRDKKDAEKRKKDKNTSDYKMRMFNQMENIWGEITEKDDKSGKELNNPTRGDVKKYKVYVKNDKGNVVKVEFGDPNMSIKRDDPERRKSFRARHNCENPGPKWKARYWSCKFWSTKSVTDLMKG